jgi:hypothetical protein
MFQLFSGLISCICICTYKLLVLQNGLYLIAWYKYCEINKLVFLLTVNKKIKLKKEVRTPHNTENLNTAFMGMTMTN